MKKDGMSKTLYTLEDQETEKVNGVFQTKVEVWEGFGLIHERVIGI